MPRLVLLAAALLFASCTSAPPVPAGPSWAGDSARTTPASDPRRMVLCTASYTNDGPMKGQSLDLGKVTLDVNTYERVAFDRKKLRIDARDRVLYLELNSEVRQISRLPDKSVRKAQIVAYLVTGSDQPISRASAELVPGGFGQGDVVLMLSDFSQAGLTDEIIVSCKPL